MCRSLLFVAVVLLGTALAPTAEANDVQACLSASEKGQRARAAGKMREARELFTVCGNDGCPALVRKDCAQWNAELASTMPSVVFGARDKAGRDLFDVSVSMDGEELAKKLDGKAVPVDPGPHTFRFEHAGFQPISERVLVKEGERARVVTVTFEATPPKPSDPPPPPPAQNQEGHTIFPLLVAGAGIATAAVGIILFVTTPTRPENCSEETKKCVKGQNQTDAEFQEQQEDAGRADSQPTLALAVTAAGGALIVGGLVWYMLEPTKKSASGTRVSPWMTGQSGGLSVGGAF